MLRKAIRRLPFLLTLLLLPALSAPGETWYVRADGAPPFSPGIEKLAWRGLDAKHTCDGHHDAAWPKPGTRNILGSTSNGRNQPCAVSDWRWLYDDQGSYGKLTWIIGGGDTVILDNTKAWRVGWEGNGSNMKDEPWCWGWSGGAYGCYNPPLPAGTPEHHTRILGRHWEHCSADGLPDKSRMTELFGGHGAGSALNLSDAQYVDVECLNITRHSQCVLHGDPMLPVPCKKDYPLDDFDSSGIYTSTGTHDLLLQDLWIHGHTDRGIIGPIGGLVTSNRVDIAYNGMAGWDFDDGRGTPLVNATLKMNGTIIEWSGCNQEYPIVHANPVLACYGQSNGGYGDGIGTPAHSGLNVVIDHSMFRYNVQDGEDFGHVDVGSYSLSITNSVSYGNGGGQFKWGGNFTRAVFVNNIAVGNCMRMSQPMAGTPAAYNAHLADFCRANDAISFNFHQGATLLFANNTIVSYAPTTFDYECWEASCSQTHFIFRNNIVLGLENRSTFSLGGKPGGPGAFYNERPVGHVERSNNLFFGLRNLRCNSTEICKDPQFIGEGRFTQESDLDHFNFHVAATSPARHAGAHLPEVSTDIEGKPRPANGNGTLGAIE